MKTKSLSCGISLSQTIFWLFIFLSSWNLLNWPLSKSLTTLKMKRHYPRWHIWSCNFIIIWWGVWTLLYKCLHMIFYSLIFFPFPSYYYKLEWWIITVWNDKLELMNNFKYFNCSLVLMFLVVVVCDVVICKLLLSYIGILQVSSFGVTWRFF